MIRILNFKNEIELVDTGTIGIWTDDSGFEWELYFNANNEFDGVRCDDLTDEQLQQLKGDCVNNKGFYDPLFQDTNIAEYSITYEV